MRSKAYELSSSSMAFPKKASPPTSPIEWGGSQVSDNDSGDSTAADLDAAKLAGRCIVHTLKVE